MKLINHFHHITLTSDQQYALEKLQAFLESDESVFILQGYAGSGKTTILKGLVEYLVSIGKKFEVMAPTGRAAKILRDKTEFGQTIHKSIYNFEKLHTYQKNDNEEDQAFQYIFPIRQNEAAGNIIIVDEASMISSRESKNELFTFGTDILLNDLLTYSKVPFSTNKIIFVGDPAQLPPVGDNTSKALSNEYFEELNIKTAGSTLTQVVRQQDNTILGNATKIRSLIGSDVRNELSLTYDETCFIKIKCEDIASRFVEKFPNPKIGAGVIIAFSNSQCLQYNRMVRSKIFPEKHSVTNGDLVIINHNNYHTYDVEFLNGEIAEITEADRNVISRNNIPVYETINGKRVKKHVDLTFRQVTLKTEHHSKEVKCLIIDSLLNSPNRDLTNTEMIALYIDFVMRFQNEQNERKDNGLTPFKIGSSEFNQQLKSDLFFNALRVKYGYAVTCHKAQGGEWQTTFVDYYGRTSLKDDPLRWSYTATTRAVEKCFAANAPNVSVFSRFDIGEIQQLTKVPVNALAFEGIPLSPYHKESQHKAKSLKYWEILEKLESSPYQIVSVNSHGEYQERYTLSFEDEKSQFDTFHNNAGLFNEFNAVHPNENMWQKEALSLLNQPHQVVYNVEYKPSALVFENLYGMMQSLCSEEDITITNIEEKTESYFVQYFLKTDAKCALIQFYFNGKGQLSRAMPKSTSNKDDEKLNSLILKLKAYVI